MKKRGMRLTSMEIMLTQAAHAVPAAGGDLVSP